MAAKHAQAMEQLRRDEAVRAAQKAGERVAIAEQLIEQGDVGTAAVILKRALLSRRAAGGVKQHAATLLTQIQEQGEQQYEVVEEAVRYASSMTEMRDALDDLADLKLDYGSTPQLGKKIDALTRRVARSDRVIKFRKEEQAADFMTEARRLEGKGELCCAFLFYEKAAEFDSTSIGRDAAAKLERLKMDELLVEQVEQCRQIRTCQAQFDRAMKMLKHPKQRSKGYDLLTRVIEHSPTDSEVHKAAIALISD